MPGISAPSSSHSSRERSAASSSPRARPDTQTRPKLRTVAPRASASRSSWTTSWPRRTASRACVVPRMPPPTIVTRIAADPSRRARRAPRPAGVAAAEQQVNNWYRPIAGMRCRMPVLDEVARTACDSLRGVWDEEAVDELDHALQSAARAHRRRRRRRTGAGRRAARPRRTARCSATSRPAPRRHRPGLADAAVRRAGGLAGRRPRRGQALSGGHRPGLRRHAVRRIGRLAAPPGWRRGRPRIRRPPVVAGRAAAAAVRRRGEGSAAQRPPPIDDVLAVAERVLAQRSPGELAAAAAQAVPGPHRGRRHPRRPRTRAIRFRPSGNSRRGSGCRARRSARPCTSCSSRAASSGAAAAPWCRGPNSSSRCRCSPTPKARPSAGGCPAGCR